jgi:UDP-N-acetylglucosamine 2-epimerase
VLRDGEVGTRLRRDTETLQILTVSGTRPEAIKLAAVIRELRKHSYRRVPHLTMRENTERPVTVTQGTNTVVGCDPGQIVGEALAILDGEGRAVKVPELWDGWAARRIVDVLELWEGQVPGVEGVGAKDSV